jgi:hypothetical protein
MYYISITCNFSGVPPFVKKLEEYDLSSYPEKNERK